MKWKARTIAWGVLLAASTVTHLVAFPDHPRVHSDTNSFLHLVAYCLEPGAAESLPYRLGNPLYSLLICGLLPFSGSDWVLAARLAALLPGILLAPAICAVAWQLSRNYWSGVAAGGMAAASTPLITQAMVPLSDSLFVLLSAVFLIPALEYVRQPRATLGALAGLAGGLAYAARGPAAFYPGIVLLALLFGLVQLEANQSTITPGPRGTRGKRIVFSFLVFLAAFAAVGKAPSLVLQARARSWNLPSGFSYTKNVFVDGGLYAQGQARRDAVMYTLNDDCTGFALVDDLDKPWSEILREYGLQQLRGFRTNFRTNCVTVMPDTLAPFLFTFLPLALGMILCWRRCSPSEVVFLLGFVGIYALIIPGIQLQARYVLPLCAVTYPLMGIGARELLSCNAESLRTKNLLARGVGVVLLCGFFVLGIGALRRIATQKDVDRYYREASSWLLQHVDDPQVAIMARRHCVYAYTRRPTVSLPVDALPRVLRYCAHVRCRYLVLGPDEQQHNPHLADLELPARCNGWELRCRASFGEGAQTVRIVEVSDGLP